MSSRAEGAGALQGLFHKSTDPGPKGSMLIVHGLTHLPLGVGLPGMNLGTHTETRAAPEGRCLTSK